LLFSSTGGFLVEEGGPASDARRTYQGDTKMNGQSRRITVPAFVIGASLIIVVASTLVLVTMVGPMTGLQVAVTLLLLIVGASLAFRRDTELPFLFRPTPAIAASVIVGSVSAPFLQSADHEQFMILWVCLVAGVILGALLTQSGGVFRGRDFASIDRDALIRASVWVLIISAISAMGFFAWQGVPALAGNVEQSRVDAAVQGSGYLRLVAYLGIPAVHMLFAARHRLAVPGLILCLLIILGLANRSPLLYLFVPLLIIFSSQKRIRLNSARILGAVGVAVVLVLSIGTFRVFSQDEFARYDEYRVNIASENYVAVGATTFVQYAQVVADNAVLTKALVDEGAIPLKFGSTYATLFVSAFPGEQLSLDRLIKLESGASFVGGGTPPTLMGEGYVNFGIPGVVGIGVFVVLLLRYWLYRYKQSIDFGDPVLIAASAAVYGYMLCWVVGSPVAGLAGASTFPLAGALVLVLLRALATRYKPRAA
jgi:oligosaccharide repeat unit polymerase